MLCFTLNKTNTFLKGHLFQKELTSVTTWKACCIICNSAGCISGVCIGAAVGTDIGGGWNIGCCWPINDWNRTVASGMLIARASNICGLLSTPVAGDEAGCSWGCSWGAAVGNAAGNCAGDVPNGAGRGGSPPTDTKRFGCGWSGGRNVNAENGFVFESAGCPLPG